jgi:2-oxo-4-hydroxy-4-carboxy--5-ureidoimidazoline (OHCU) decarboxylase
MGAAEEALTELAEQNRLYEARFGHVFLFAAAGKSAAEVLAALRERMSNDPATELRVAADQQRRITRLRLESMLQR